MGMLKASERDDKRVHPTQKPVALFHRIITEHTQPGDLILDPYMGSGPVARAAADLGRRYIGIEIEERYCEIAARRLEQSVLPLTVPA
jgi:DNA modification methylase